MDDVVLHEKLVLLDADVKSRDELLGRLADTLCTQGYVKESYREGVLTREQNFPTGLPTQPYGVAIPHTDIVHVHTPAIAIARIKNPVDFIMMGEAETVVPVQLCFMLAMKEAHAQLDLLQRLMSLLQDAEALTFLMQAADAEQVVSYVNDVLKG